jgi:hypothetical protein
MRGLYEQVSGVLVVRTSLERERLFPRFLKIDEIEGCSGAETES